MKSDIPYLAHIADSIAAIENFVNGDRDRFLKERLIQDAVVRNFEIIGEAAGRLSEGLKESSSAPFAKAIAFRNRLIHGYWSVDLLLVWDVIINELPVLKMEVERLLRALGSENQN